MFSSSEILHPKYMNVFTCYNTVLFITILLLNGTCPSNNTITLDFSGVL